MISTVFGVFEMIDGHFELVDYFDRIRPALELLDELRSNHPKRDYMVDNISIDLDTGEILDYGF